MNNRFLLGAVAGMSSLAIAVPLVAQLSSAQTPSSAPSTTTRPVPTQACVQAMATLETAHLANFDVMTATHKQQMQARRDALVAAGAIADDTQRQAALQAMKESMRTAEPPAIPEAITTAMDAVKTACGNMKFGMKGFGGPMMKMFGGLAHGMKGDRGFFFKQAPASTTESSTSTQQ